MNPNTGAPFGVTKDAANTFGNLAGLSDPSQFTGSFGDIMKIGPQTTRPTTSLNPQAAAKTNTSQGVLPAFGSKLASIGKTVGGLALGAGEWLGKAAVDSIEAPVKYVGYQAKNAYDSVQGIGLDAQILGLNGQQKQLSSDYATGRISKQQYQAGLSQLVKDKATLTKRSLDNNQAVIHDIQAARGQTTTLASDALSVLTAGGSKLAASAVKDAGTALAVKFLGKSDIVDSLSAAATKIASKLPDSTVNNVWFKQALQTGTQDAADLSSQQIAKKVALNLLFKRPIIYQTNFGIASNIYDELQNKKYGGAVRDLALTASLTLAGGPIGLALKQGGKALTGIKNAIFGERSFVDMLSSRIGNGDASALFKVLEKDPELAKDFKVMEQTNLSATNGQVTAAVNRITDYLSKELGWSLSGMTHEQLAADLSNFSKSRDDLVQAAKDGLIKGINPEDAERITVGRWSVSDSNQLALMFEKADAELPNPQPYEAITHAKPPIEDHNVSLPTKKTFTPLQEDQRFPNSFIPKKLDEVITNDKLFKKYPELKNITVKYHRLGDHAPGLTGMYDAIKKTISLPHDTDNKAKIGSIIHEIQHAIQDLEGRIEQTNKGGFHEYSNHPLEVDARETSDRLKSKYSLAGEAESSSPLQLPSKELRNVSVPPREASPDISLDKIAARRAVMEQLQNLHGSNAAWLNNANLQKQIDKIITTEDNAGEAIRSIDAQIGLSGVPPKLANKLRQRGYISIMPEELSAPYVKYSEDLGPIKSAHASNDNPMFRHSVQALPVVEHVGAFLSRIGVSPEDSSGITGRMFETNFKSNLIDSGLPVLHGDTPDSMADDIVHRLSDYAKDDTGRLLNKFRGPITDYRQMTLKDIQEALNVDKADAQSVRNSIHSAMLRIPLQVRGLGDRVMDYNYRYNPAAGAYSRAQGAYRFVYNPFFRWQQTTQTEFMSQLLAGGKFPTYTGWNKIAQWAFPERYGTLDTTVKILEDKGIFGGGLSGSAAELEGAGKITTRLLPGEKKSLAGLVQVMAEKSDLPTEEFVNSNTPLVADTLRSLVQYSKHEGFVNSPLARTINYAFFPFRYNIKVAGLIAKYVAQQPPALQVAMIKSVMTFGSWLKSDEGQSWYSKNSDAIQLFNWLSPLYPLSYIGKILTGNAKSISDYGQLGGLPFGLISQMLSSQGIMHVNAPYITPKTGDPLPSYIPQTLKARANLAIQDLLGSVFSYPGATAGLPSKSGILRTAVGGIIPGSSKEFKKVQPTLSPAEQARSDQIKRVNSAPPQTLTGQNGQPMVPYQGPVIPSVVTLAHQPATPRKAIQGLTPLQINQSKQGGGIRPKESSIKPRSIAVR